MRAGENPFDCTTFLFDAREQPDFPKVCRFMSVWSAAMVLAKALLVPSHAAQSKDEVGRPPIRTLTAGPEDKLSLFLKQHLKRLRR